MCPEQKASCQHTNQQLGFYTGQRYHVRIENNNIKRSNMVECRSMDVVKVGGGGVRFHTLYSLCVCVGSR